jgi:addiction module RelE/StbE family toxin
MAQIIYSGQALSDLERISEFLAEDSPALALETLDLIDEAIAILERHPLIGRMAESHLRELIISQGRTGYVALYSYDQFDDVLLILAIRHQREAGFQAVLNN